MPQIASIIYELLIQETSRICTTSEDLHELGYEIGIRFSEKFSNLS